MRCNKEKQGLNPRNPNHSIRKGFAACLFLAGSICASGGVSAQSADATTGWNDVETRVVDVSRTIVGIHVRLLPGSDGPYTYMVGCEWANLRARLKARLEGNTREALVAILQGSLSSSSASSVTKLNAAFAGSATSLFRRVLPEIFLGLSEEKQANLRAGLEVQASGEPGASCMIRELEAQRLIESATRVYELYTGARRNAP